MARKKAAAEVVTIYDRQAAAPDPAIIVFGQNDRGTAQGAWFSGADAEVALQAARLMGLRAAMIDTDRHRALAGQLQQGQVFGSDRTFAPAVGQELYNELFDLCGSAPIENPSLQRPDSFEEITVGALVLARDGGEGDPWFEAVVLAANNHLLQLRWRNSARDASFIRSRSQIALPAPEAA